MERTLDSIRPSDDETVGGDMSYLYGRDPSILAYGQRPIPCTRQNLISLYEDEESQYQDETTSTTSDLGSLQTVKVYLRMKPFPRKMKLTEEQTTAYKITGPTTLVMKLPSLDNTCGSSKGHKNAESVCRKFTFSQTFGPETTQLQLFEQIIQQRMVDFLAGQNCTVMTYGTTNSGKSYTLQGTTTSPGIIPRGLEFVFSNINPRPTPCYKPTQNSSVVCLNAVDRAQEIEAKNKLLTFASTDKYHYINAYKQMQKLLQEESPIRPSQACDAQYSVWVSFAEIYNESIYDLLSNDCQKRRPLLKLAADNQDRAFIKGLKTICVNSGSEAYQVLMAGQYNLKVAATALNARSSRSHCIFTIQLLKYYIENEPNSVEISTFTFCDLAGSERVKKTLNVGDRLREAQNINTSLLVLGRCLKSIYEGQSTRQRHEHVGPFRESKLTRLFQRALSGKEQIALVVNVNPIPNLYTETQNVLNFSAIAKKIVIETKKVVRKITSTRFSQIVARRSTTDWEPNDLVQVIENPDVQSPIIDSDSDILLQEDFDELLEENKGLKEEINALKVTMLNKDLQIRRELADTYSAMMKKVEDDWKNRIKDVEERQEDQLEWGLNIVENFYKDKIEELSSRKRRRTDDSYSGDDTRDIGELEIENSRLEAKVHALGKKNKALKDSNETLMEEKNKISFELGFAKEELKSVKELLTSAQNELFKDEETSEYVKDLRNQLTKKQEHVKNLKEFLNEAKEEYISIASHAGTMERRLKECEENLAESQECVADLKLVLEQTNACLDEKTKTIDELEEKLSRQSCLALKAEDRHRSTEATLSEVISQLKKKIASLENSSHDSSEDSKVPEIEIKEEILSESDGDVSREFGNSVSTPGIKIKTDNEEILDIPTSNFENDRESEVFVQVREISINDEMIDSTNIMEIRRKLEISEFENENLRTELSQRFLEFKLLKESHDSTKQQLNDIAIEVEELKKRDLENERENSKIRENDISLKNIECQTCEIPISDVFCQTEIIEEDSSRDEKSSQTEILENEELKKMEDCMSKLSEKCIELEAEFEEKKSIINDLHQQLDNLQDINESLKEKLNHEISLTEKLKSSTQILGDDLARITVERNLMKKELNDIEDLRKKEEIEISQCRNEHTSKIAILMENLNSAKVEKEIFQKKLLDSEEHQKNLETQLRETHDNKISELESSFAAERKIHTDNIAELNNCIERCEKEKNELEKRLTDNTNELEILKKRLQQAAKKDEEKDEEIRQLQKAIKKNLNADMEDKKAHVENEKITKEWMETKEELVRTKELYERSRASWKKERDCLQSENTILEKNIKLLEKLHKKELKEHDDLERLKKERDDLKILINEKEHEMEAFKANRDVTITKYESLLKSNQGELERSKREVTRLQALLHGLPTTPRGKTMKSEEEDEKPLIAVVDLSDSETKRSTRRAILAPPAAAPEKNTTRSTRKKKLYVHPDDSCIDVDMSDAVPPTPSPSTSTRSLRNRRK